MLSGSHCILTSRDKTNTLLKQHASLRFIVPSRRYGAPEDLYKLSAKLAFIQEKCAVSASDFLVILYLDPENSETALEEWNIQRQMFAAIDDNKEEALTSLPDSKVITADQFRKNYQPIWDLLEGLYTQYTQNPINKSRVEIFFREDNQAYMQRLRKKGVAFAESEDALSTDTKEKDALYLSDLYEFAKKFPGDKRSKTYKSKFNEAVDVLLFAFLKIIEPAELRSNLSENLTLESIIQFMVPAIALSAHDLNTTVIKDLVENKLAICGLPRHALTVTNCTYDTRQRWSRYNSNDGSNVELQPDNKPVPPLPASVAAAAAAASAIDSRDWVRSNPSSADSASKGVALLSIFGFLVQQGTSPDHVAQFAKAVIEDPQLVHNIISASSKPAFGLYRAATPPACGSGASPSAPVLNTSTGMRLNQRHS